MGKTGFAHKNEKIITGYSSLVHDNFIFSGILSNFQLVFPVVAT